MTAPRARRRPAALRLLLSALLVLPLAACGSGGGSGPGDADGAGAGADGGDTALTVLAAASLTDVLEEAKPLYESERGVELRLSFAGSQELAAQVREGVPADVLVTADSTSMDGVADRTEGPVVIAENELTIVTAPGNPEDVTGLADLAREDLTVVLAAPEVPVGRYGQQILDEAGVRVNPASQETNVRSVLTKVTLGEADVGIVYATDAASAGDRVATVTIPAAQNVLAEYPAAALSEAPNPVEAAAFVSWLRSDRAVELLETAGFRVP
ncbi:molybdate ABC transporter substrate-binding protein [Streptomyces otsuchiensis]|uniref:molybdate ABC transporter substrate-binding protein n=1 Tax=Streptomyces otsuchiensis TaxID=2681388 RepID=UPI001032635F|nr:molybdate ABC transporter substrate-binding protein [Streptomyces otsuchiensis]